MALDHGAIVGPQPGWTDPEPTIRAILDARPDAIITTLGIFQKYVDPIKGSKTPIILSVPLMDDVSNVIELSAKMGVDAVKFFLAVNGGNDDSYNLLKFYKATTICSSYGIPVVGEMYPVKSDKIADPRNQDIVAKYSRIGMESGANVIKTFYTGSEESFREVVRSCPIPVLILGGEKMNTDKELLETIGAAMRAGAAGAAIGRNVWQHKDPNTITKSIIKVIHGS